MDQTLVEIYPRKRAIVCIQVNLGIYHIIICIESLHLHQEQSVQPCKRAVTLDIYIYLLTNVFHREAVLNKKKAISISFCFCNQKPKCIKNCCEIASDIAQHLYNSDMPWPENGLFNINIPMLDYRCPIHLTDFHIANYGSLFKQLDKQGSRFKFSPDFTAINQDKDGLPGTDKWALMNHCVSGICSFFSIYMYV